MVQEDKVSRDDYDSPWKEALVEHLPDFFEFFFPRISTEVDWSVSASFLDKELRQVDREAELGRRYADVLVGLRTLTGQEFLALVHVEVQQRKDLDFARRMVIYNYRLYDLFQRPICSLAVLADLEPT